MARFLVFNFTPLYCHYHDKGQNAEFILYSKSKNKWAQVTNGNISGWSDEQNATKLDTGSTGTFTVKGLDAGEYTLKETKEPTGFLMPSNRETKFTITANLTETLDATSATAADAISNLKINNSADNANTSTGQVKLVIENSRSGSLPSTGSMGMFIMIGVGICLMAGAGIYLLKNRKKA
ncbi:MAG: LPXTG cell wall anchor domain-containing protein [Eubacteriaceae bacterium]|nr:LPXTG cell wall anchor domain-containing protein [Eubacteriaceae bacterium]